MRRANVSNQDCQLNHFGIGATSYRNKDALTQRYICSYIMYKEQTAWLSYIDSALRSHKGLKDRHHNICDGFEQLTSVAQLHRKSCIPGLIQLIT